MIIYESINTNVIWRHPKDRTRSSLLKMLFDELMEKNALMFDMGNTTDATSVSTMRQHASSLISSTSWLIDYHCLKQGTQKGKLFTSLRKAIRGRSSPVSRSLSMKETTSSTDDMDVSLDDKKVRMMHSTGQCDSCLWNSLSWYKCWQYDLVFVAAWTSGRGKPASLYCSTTVESTLLLTLFSFRKSEENPHSHSFQKRKAPKSGKGL